jgi:hypothetical protein
MSTTTESTARIISNNMELSFQLLLVQIQYAGRHKQKLFPFAQDGFRDLTSTTLLLKIVTTSKEETTGPKQIAGVRL